MKKTFVIIRVIRGQLIYLHNFFINAFILHIQKCDLRGEAIMENELSTNYNLIHYVTGQANSHEKVLMKSIWN